MSKLRRVTADVSGLIAEKIEAAIEAGEFRSPKDAVESVLFNWALDRLSSGQIEYMRRACEEGMASGIAGPFDIEGIICEAKAEKRERDRARHRSAL